MATLIANNASTTTTGVTASDATTISVTSGSGFPSVTAGDHFYATLEAADGTIEIVKVTSNNTNSFVVSRAQDGTTAAEWGAGTKIELRMNKQALDERYFLQGTTQISQASIEYTGPASDTDFYFGTAPTSLFATKTIKIGTGAQLGGITNINIGDSSQYSNINTYGNFTHLISASTGFEVKADADIDTNVYITSATNDHMANLEIRGDSGKQCTGRLYIGQSDTFGGGMVYYGDNDPSITANMGGTGSQDRLTFFKRSSGTDYWLFRLNNAQSYNMDFRGNITAYASDERLKTNITPITNPLEKLQQVRGVEYDWRDDVEEKGFIPSMPHETGVIAQEVQQVVPDAVVPAPFDSEYLTVDHVKLIPLLIESIKELKEEVDCLKAKVGSQN